MIEHKLTFNQWQYIAVAGQEYLHENLVPLPESKKFVKDKFKGDFNMDIGFGHITFKSEKDLAWFLLTT